MDIKFAVLADHASITREGKLNILGVFDALNVTAFPVSLPLFYVVISYEAGAAEFDSTKKTEIVLCDEDGNELLKYQQELKVMRPQIKGIKATTNQIAGIIGFQFKIAGSYQFDILVNGESKKQISLRVNELGQQEKQK